MQLNIQHDPLISILLPTHNRADVLPFAIQSVLAQTIQDFELLIVGDGCTDNTAEVVKSFNDARIHWFDLQKAPAFGYANRNIVLQKARGKFVAYKAHDDLWFSDHLEQLLPFFENEIIEIAFSRPLLVIPPAMIIPGIFNLNDPSTLEIFINARNGIPSGCAIHRRDCFDKYGYWNDTLPIAADWDMWKRIITGGARKNFAYLDKGTCLHFKANWRNDAYDLYFGFYFWKRLFASNQMPKALIVDTADYLTEQEAIWKVMSLQPQAWNKKIRTALTQVLDACAARGNFLADSLLDLNNEFSKEPLNANFPGFDSSDLTALLRKTLKDIQTKLDNSQKELNDIKTTLTWKLHERILNLNIFLKLYQAVFVPIIKRWRTTKK